MSGGVRAGLGVRSTKWLSAVGVGLLGGILAVLLTPVVRAQQLDWVAPKAGSVTATDLPPIILRMPAGLAAGDLSRWQVLVDGEAWPFVLYPGTQTVTIQLERALGRGPHEVVVRAWQANTQQVHEVGAVFSVLQETPPPRVIGVQTQGKLQLRVGWQNGWFSYDGSGSIGLSQKRGDWQVRSESEWRLLPYGGELAWGTPGFFLHLAGARLDLTGGPGGQQHVQVGQFGLGKGNSLAYSSTLVVGAAWEQGDLLMIGVGQAREAGEGSPYMLGVRGGWGEVTLATYHSLGGDQGRLLSGSDLGDGVRTHLVEATWKPGSLQLDGAVSQRVEAGSTRTGAGLELQQSGAVGEIAAWRLLARWTSPQFTSLNRQIPAGTVFSRLETIVATEPMLRGSLSLTQRADGSRVIAGDAGAQNSQARYNWEVTATAVQVHNGPATPAVYTLGGDSKATYRSPSGLSLTGGYSLARLGPWVGVPLRTDSKGYTQLEGVVGAAGWQLRWERTHQLYPQACLRSQQDQWSLQLKGGWGAGEGQRWQLGWLRADDWAQAGAATPARIVRQNLEASASGVLGPLWTWEGKVKAEQSNLSVRPTWETTWTLGFQF